MRNNKGFIQWIVGIGIVGILSGAGLGAWSVFKKGIKYDEHIETRDKKIKELNKSLSKCQKKLTNHPLKRLLAQCKKAATATDKRLSRKLDSCKKNRDKDKKSCQRKRLKQENTRLGNELAACQTHFPPKNETDTPPPAPPKKEKSCWFFCGGDE